MIITTWLIWETRQILDNTSSKFFVRIKENSWAVISIPILVLLAILSLWIIGKIFVAWIVLPLGVWIIMLLLSKQLSVIKKITLFFDGFCPFPNDYG